LFRIALPGYVHIEGWRAGAQQVVVHGGDLQAFGQQLGQHGINFGFRQDEIAHHHGRVAHGFEGDPAAEGEARFDLDPIERDFEIGSRQSVAMNGPAHRGRAAKDQLDFLPVRFGSKGQRVAKAQEGFDGSRRRGERRAFRGADEAGELFGSDAVDRRHGASLQ